MKRLNKLDVLNQIITKIECIKKTQEINTGKWTHTYYIYLKNGTILSLCPDLLIQITSTQSKNLIIPYPLQIIDGDSDIIGESILSVIFEPFKCNSVDSNDRARYGLVLSSGRIAINTFLCGGASILHIENSEGLKWAQIEEWETMSFE